MDDLWHETVGAERTVLTMKYAIIGFGSISPMHVRAITEICKKEIVAICDTRKLDELKIGLPRVRLYQDYHELFAKEKVDVAVVCTPHYFHPEISVAALKAGCHVYCEKPVAVHKLHAEPIAKTLGETDRVFGVNNMRRFRPDVQAVKALLNDNILGRIHNVHFVSNNLLRSSAYFQSDGGWRGTWAKEGGGALINQSMHDVDRITYLFGLPVEVQAQAGTSDLHQGMLVEDYVEAMLSYQNGMRLFYSTALHLHPGVDRLEMWGDGGYIKVENGMMTKALLQEPLGIWNDRTKDIKMINGVKIFDTPQAVSSEYKITPLAFFDMHALGHVNFLNAIEGREPVMTSFEQALQSVELANAMVLAGYQKKMVTLPLNGQVYSDFLGGMIKEETGSIQCLS